MQDDRKIAEDTLRTAVAAIRHHHDHKKQPKLPPLGTDAASVTPSDADTPHEYDMVLDGYMSVVLVIEAAAKCLYLRCNAAANRQMDKYCIRFLKRLKGGEISEDREISPVVKKLVAIRNALSHANAHTRYDYLPHDPASLVPMFILYEQEKPPKKRNGTGDEVHPTEVQRYSDEVHEKRDAYKDKVEKRDGSKAADPDTVHYREAHRYTTRQFAHLCATMREVFLSWDLIDPNQEVRIGMREVQMAVMARYAICQQSCSRTFSIATACMCTCEYDIVVSCMSLPPFRDTDEEKPVEAKTN